MSANPRRRRVELRIVEVPPDDDDQGSGGGGGAGGGDTGDQPRPIVEIAAGWRSQALDEAEQHLVKRDRDLFQRGRQIVRVAATQLDIGQGRRVSTLAIVPVGVQHMRERFTRAVDLRRFDKRADEWRTSDCPADFAEAYLERYGWWRVPVLRQVTTAPTIRPDGTIIEKRGYDRKSQIYYDPRETVFPKVPAAPTRSDARDALERLKTSLLSTFDFVSAADTSVALSGIMTALLRPAMTAAPLHAFTAPVAGAGKSKLVQIAAILRCGHPIPATALGKREEEAEKRLGASLIAGDPIISLDNIDQALGGEMIDQLVTEPLVNVRMLGQSINQQVPNVYCIFATGNNLALIGDLGRRTLLGRLDPQCERPELREFSTPDPVLVAARERPMLVVLVLTIARAFFLAGCPQDAAPLGSFAEWSRWVRDPLMWLGQADPVETMEQSRREDQRLTMLAEVLGQWEMVIGADNPRTVREVVELTEQQEFGGRLSHPDFREALLGAAGRRGRLDAQGLGNWLGRVKGRPVAGRRFDPAPQSHGVARWQLTITR